METIACLKTGKNFAWFKRFFSFVLAVTALLLPTDLMGIPPDQGPGGPILIVASSTNPFTRYYAEILRAEGLNSFAVADISEITATTLGSYDVVVLGQVALTSAQVTMFSDFVTAGGSLIAMRPDKKLAGLLGLTDAFSTLSDKYLLINSSGAGQGLVNQTIQFHGTADLYTPSAASVVATLYSAAGAATGNPAVSLRAVGPYGGMAAAFAFDLARSVVYTRQGNPAWEKQLRDPNTGCISTGAQPCATGQIPPIRAYDLFYGPASFDNQPDWVDTNKISIPQADEQQRLLANLILTMNQHRKPLPRFWYFPRGYKAVVVMTGDDHANGGTAGRFNNYIIASPAGCSVANWECIRSTSYIYPTTPLTNAQLANYTAMGFEVAVHLHTSCGNWGTLVALNSYYMTQIAAFQQAFPSLPPVTTNRTHCTVWSDYSTHATVESMRGIRLDTNYYYYPSSWVLNRPGLFTGSGMPMRFATIDGTMIDTYQATTQLTDESGIAYSIHISSLLDKALGAEGYYGAFTANMHTDAVTSVGSDAIISAALARKVPVVSAKQMLLWLDGRNGSTFNNLSWAGNALTFNVAVASGSDGIQAMLPTASAVGPLTGITLNGSPVSYTKQIIKGIEYAFFPSVAGAYIASYASGGVPPVPPNTTPPDTVITGGPTATSTSKSATFDFTSTKAGSTFTCSLDGAAFAPCTSPASYFGLAVSVHTFAVRATDSNGITDPTPASLTWTITASSASSPSSSSSFRDSTIADFSAGTLDAGIYIGSSVDGNVTLAPKVTADFSGSALPSTWFSSSRVSLGKVSFGGAAALIDGAIIGTNEFQDVGRSLEINATFSGDPYQHVGFGKDFNSPPWAIFSTWYGGALFARTSNGAASTATAIPGNWLNAPHRFRIDWVAGSVTYSIDGSVVATHAIPITSAMRVLASDDSSADGRLVSVNWARMTPFATPGTFLSRILDSGGGSTWGTATWLSNTPAGTSLQISVRTGDTPVPDGSWTPFAVLAAPGATIGSSQRYLQYRAILATNDPSKTPGLNEFTIQIVRPLGDTTASDFSAGAPDAGISIANAAGGEVMLASSSGALSLSSALPPGWFGVGRAAGGALAFSGGAANLDGVMIGTLAFYNPSQSVEFVGSFSGGGYQHIGFGTDIGGAPWAMFSTMYGGGLYVRTNNGFKTTDTLIPGNWFNSTHTYRVDWNASTVVFWIDGAVVATHSITISSVMRPLATDDYRDGRGIAVNSVRFNAYASSGTFLSRIFDAGSVITWTSATWNSVAPTGTSLQISVRTGNTPVPDATWGAFTPLASGGAPSGASRYLQYRAVLTSNDPGQTPVLNDITFK